MLTKPQPVNLWTRPSPSHTTSCSQALQLSKSDCSWSSRLVARGSLTRPAPRPRWATRIMDFRWAAFSARRLPGQTPLNTVHLRCPLPPRPFNFKCSRHHYRCNSSLLLEGKLQIRSWSQSNSCSKCLARLKQGITQLHPQLAAESTSTQVRAYLCILEG